MDFGLLWKGCRVASVKLPNSFLLLHPLLASISCFSASAAVRGIVSRHVRACYLVPVTRPVDSQCCPRLRSFFLRVSVVHPHAQPPSSRWSWYTPFRRRGLRHEAKRFVQGYRYVAGIASSRFTGNLTRTAP
ncbi:hypothetical protein BDP27DRAFT_1335911 [Rhodocollybia butyracea]|uniref:Uncharacterized protein n=1 Tax=Rhodocollybia butyracea TaxID=206335 RepID=A0A9P5U200_9AGAR|nr:hypothetical protein BDP27DRAFT_1335911 [Rhodocollybia butyracea]